MTPVLLFLSVLILCGLVCLITNAMIEREYRLELERRRELDRQSDEATRRLFRRLSDDKYFESLPVNKEEVIFEEMDTSKPTCATCRGQEGEEWVVCSKCKTPHHKDCWEYCGCAVYGCSCQRQASGNRILMKRLLKSRASSIMVIPTTDNRVTQVRFLPRPL